MDQNKDQGTQKDRRPGEEQFEPNQNANKEPAEGSRERSGQGGAQPGQQPGGVTNRPMDREQQEQRDVPPRGETKDEDRNA